MCVPDDLCVSLVGDPRNRRPNTDCPWEENREAEAGKVGGEGTLCTL